MKNLRNLLLLATFALSSAASLPAAVPNSFSYQGRLFAGTNAVTGLYDLKFTVYDTASSGNVLGPTASFIAVPVTNGVFTVSIDVGPAFDGSTRWLEIAERTNAASAYVTLSPRQAITAAPQALYAAKAGNASSVGYLSFALTPDGSILSAVGNGGLGISMPGNFTNLVLGWNDSSCLYMGSCINTGLNATAFGFQTAAGNRYATALGNRTTANGESSTAIGEGAVASGLGATAIGYGTRALGDWSLATGYGSRATGIVSSAIGNGVLAGGMGSFAAGTRSVANHEGTFVWSDNSPGTWQSQRPGQFLVRAAAGVGINTDNPQDALHVNGTVRATSFRSESDVNFSGIVYAGMLNLHGAINMNGYDVLLSPPDKTSAGLGFYDGERRFGTTALGGPVLYCGPSGSGGLGARLGVTDTNILGLLALQWTANNSVLICGASNDQINGRDSFGGGPLTRVEHPNSFLWADGSSTNSLYTTTSNSFKVRAAGGVTFASNPAATAGVYLPAGGTSWLTLSDRAAKKNITSLDTTEVLEKLANVPVQQWNYNWESDSATPHIGPMAQDFKGAFYPGCDDKSISTLEFDGVALAAIQGLNQKVEQQKAQLATKDAQIKDLERRLTALEKLLTR